MYVSVAYYFVKELNIQMKINKECILFIVIKHQNFLELLNVKGMMAPCRTSPALNKQMT